MDKHLIIKAGTIVIHSRKDIAGRVESQRLALATSDPHVWHPGTKTSPVIYACSIQGVNTDVLLDYLDPITDKTLTPDVKKLIAEHLRPQVEAMALNLTPGQKAHLFDYLQGGLGVMAEEQNIFEIIRLDTLPGLQIT